MKRVSSIFRNSHSLILSLSFHFNNGFVLHHCDIIVEKCSIKSKAGDSFRSMYESPNDVPENFIMQIAFTAQNSFMLTTDGRLFSWGENDNPASGVVVEE